MFFSSITWAVKSWGEALDNEDEDGVIGGLWVALSSSVRVCVRDDLLDVGFD